MKIDIDENADGRWDRQGKLLDATEAAAKCAKNTLIRYTPELEKRLRNVEALPHGQKCRYLVALPGENDDLIAKRWTRHAHTLQAGEVLIGFGS